MTNSEALAKAIELCAGNADVVEKLTNIKSSYDTKSANTSKKKEETEAKNLKLAEAYVKLMKPNTQYSATQIVELAKKADFEKPNTSQVYSALSVGEKHGLCTLGKFKVDGKGSEVTSYKVVEQATETTEDTDGQ